jgi:hypothetical protein
MHPILRALINLSSSKNPLHIDYLLQAGLIKKLETLISQGSRHFSSSLIVFVVQILSNIARY